MKPESLFVLDEGIAKYESMIVPSEEGQGVAGEVPLFCNF